MEQSRLILAILLSAISISGMSQSELSLKSENIDVSFNEYGIKSIISLDDPNPVSPLLPGFGRPQIKYKIAEGDWLTHYMAEQQMSFNDDYVNYRYYIKGMPMSLEQKFTVDKGALDWSIKLQTEMNLAVNIGDFAIPLPWKLPQGGNSEEIFEKGFVKHHYIAGDGSFIFFTRPSGKAPYLVLCAKPGTRLEYFESDDSYKVFIHSYLSGNKKEGNWRYDHSSLLLDPKGGKNDQIEYGFKIQWAFSYDEIRDILVENGLLDIRIIPGMSLPRDLEAKISIRSNQKIEDITAEYPSSTEIKFEEQNGDYNIYSVSFKKLGENMLTVNYGNGLKNHLEFFATESIETLFKKRSSFIVNSQQHIVPGKWWDGLYSVYDMKNAVLRGPENTDGYDHFWGYVLACDDPALCKAPYVAAKNVYYPDKDEIASVEYYLENFVWGGLQRTDQETPYPYGIYGTPNWMVNRDPVLRAGVKDRNLDKMNVWRSYDYPHMIMLYYHMFQIADMYPDLVNYLDADAYLERAWQTAKAYFTYPYEILPWYDTYKWGCYNEVVIEDLISSLEDEQRQEEADWLRNEYEKKVKYFIYDDDYPYRSEYAIDRTAFESSYAFARYGATNNMEADTNLWYDVKLKKWWSHPEVNKDEAREFMDQQHLAGLAVRGWLENKYFLLGSDFTTSSDKHCLSYMARMGGWSILDYGLKFAENPFDWLQLGYASYLSAWSLMNTGDEESNYGYWAPGKKNDGATGWAFMASKSGRAWIRKDVERGAWFYDGEQDLGHGSAVRMAATILAEDPIFGWFAYGGILSRDRNNYHVIPEDGLRTRFWVVTKTQRLGIELERDGFKKQHKIGWDQKKEKLSGIIENRTGSKHLTRVYLHLSGKWKFAINGEEHKIISKNGRTYVDIIVPDDECEFNIEKINN
jgi:hypothetical protein